MKRPVRAIGVSLLVLAGLVVGSELAFRAWLPASARAPLENFERYLMTGIMRGYEPRAYTVYQRPRSGDSSNRFGYNDGPWRRERTSGVPRILCLGGSTTEGGNSGGRAGTYPFQLEQVLEERTGRDFEVMNAGISGWTTAEIVPAWFLTLQDFEPDVVVVHEAVNDLEPRFFQRFEPDYSHWRKPVDVRPVAGLERWLVSASRLYLYLRLKGGHAPEILDVCADRSGPKEPLMARGELPHGTSLAFRRNVLSIARSARDEGRTVVLMTLPTSPTADIGAFWRYGVHENNQHLRDLCAEHGYLLADAEQVFAARPELAAEFIDLVHVQPQGNRAKAEIVAEALTGWLDGLSKEGARPPHLGWELQQRGAHRSR